MSQLSPAPPNLASWRPPWGSQRLRWGLIALGAIALSLYPTGLFRQALFNPGGMAQLQQFLVASVQPDLSPEFLRVTGQATRVTLAYAVCGTVLSLSLGGIGGVLASEVWWLTMWPRGRWPIRPLMRAILAVPRAIHELIWGLFFLNIFGLDPLVAILAIAVPYGAIVAKVFAEILDETPRLPLLALTHSGVGPLTALTYGLLPQAWLNLLSYSFYRFECSIRSAAVLGIIGAGGLGYEMMLSLQSLRYPQLWTLFYALFLLNGLVDLSSALVRRRLGAPSRLDLNARPRSGAIAPRPAPPTPSDLAPPKLDPVVLLAGGAMLLLIPVSFGLLQADFSQLGSARTLALLSDIGQSAWPPTLEPERWGELLTLALQTVAMSVLAIALAALGGMLLSFPAAANLVLPGGLLASAGQRGWGRILAWAGLLLTRALLLLARAIPAPIWALVVLFVLFPGILPGAIALGIHNLGILGRLMAEVNENLDQRPLVALRALGAPAPLVFLYGLLPLTFTRFLAYILYRWEVCMRETVIVGLVGAGGLGRLLTEQLSSFDYRRVVVTLACFVVLTIAVDGVSGLARRSLR